MTNTPQEAMLDRRAVVKRLLAACPDALVVTGLGSAAYDVFAAGDRPENFYLWGAMGGAAAIGLGLALAQPSRSVLVITGDGEQLMGIGALATIAAQQPGNLSIVVLDNGHFAETGMQASHTRQQAVVHQRAPCQTIGGRCQQRPRVDAPSDASLLCWVSTMR